MKVHVGICQRCGGDVYGEVIFNTDQPSNCKCDKCGMVKETVPKSDTSNEPKYEDRSH